MDRRLPPQSHPHLKVGGLIDEDVVLCGEKPEEVAAPDFIAAVTEQIGAKTVGYEVQLKLGVGVPTVGGCYVTVAPDVAVEFCR